MSRTRSEAIAFDTHRFVKNLTKSGFTEQQAETLAKEQVQLLNGNLATKADIQAIQANSPIKDVGDGSRVFSSSVQDTGFPIRACPRRL
ncbi:MAG: hypothetical protein OXI53_04625 [Nitrospira sp.]|nr:hypothetical protein [Nitrospira sp.]MDE0404575.1 hypothetical protein [Nitrospira sp.]MDE0486829.1 hypothetical protein [Nitrospira sp.]